MKIIVIGGVAGGASMAARARRLSENAEITIIERGPDVSFANCGLPYHIGGEITQRSDLALHTPRSLASLLKVDVRTETEATEVNPSAKTVRIRCLAHGTEELLSYDKLLLAPGATPLKPPLPGINHPKLHTLRDLRDMDRILEALQNAKSALVIGGGFIGLEMAEQIHHLGKEVTLVERLPQVLPPIDAELADDLSHELEARGIRVMLGQEITGFESSGQQIKALLKEGEPIITDLVILSIGVRPENELAAAAGLQLGERGHIVVNQYQQTSHPDIYAAGDVVETADSILGGSRPLPLGGPANRQGRTAADHIFFGAKAMPYPGSLGTAIVRVFDLAAASTGYGEGFLKMRGIPYHSVTINADHHAGYFPGAENIKLKILWDPESGRLLGGQAVGQKGIDKRIDVLATALRAKLTIEDLCHLELTYAPPFGSAKDPVNLAGFAACNIRDGLLNPVYEIPSSEAQIVDVRPTDGFAAKPTPGAVNIPLPELRERLNELDRSKPVFAMCQRGKSSYFAARILQQNGFEAASIIGGVNVHL